jgi:ABC-type Fe2+-enterobactin transport system substrate-binding protein
MPRPTFLPIRKAADIRLQKAERNVTWTAAESLGGSTMSKILSTAVVTGLLFALMAPAVAADAPKTKTECDKLTDMKWDAKTKTCVKK